MNLVFRFRLVSYLGDGDKKGWGIPEIDAPVLGRKLDAHTWKNMEVLFRNR